MSVENQDQETQPQPTRRARGERTRAVILDAALEVIASGGLRSITHRAVAKQAGVNLSLTTYYFKDLNDLIAQAFDHYAAVSGERRRQTWASIFADLENLSPEMLRDPDHRRMLTERFAEAAVDYIRFQLDHEKTRLAVEAAYYYDPKLPISVQKEVLAHSRLVQEDFIRLCKVMETGSPEDDGILLYGTVQRLEFEALGLQGGRNCQYIRSQLGRIIELVFLT